VTQNYPSLETAATTPTRSVCRFGFVQVPLSSSTALEIAATVASPGFITLIVRSLGPARDLYVEEPSVNAPRDSANISAPREWISWRLNREQDWPSLASLVLRIQYVSETQDGSVLTAHTAGAGSNVLRSFGL
jgi:hypothetical protein